MYGGEGGIRTPDTLTGMSDFESGAFNRALPPLRNVGHLVDHPSPPIPMSKAKLPRAESPRANPYPCLSATERGFAMTITSLPAKRFHRQCRAELSM